MSRTNQDLQDGYLPFSVKSKSGAVLSLWFAPSYTSKAKGCVVCGHPANKSGKYYFTRRGYVKFLRALGYHVVVFDFNGFGDSQMGNFDYHLDILAVGKRVSKLTHLPLIYWGVSLGGQWASLALSKNNQPFRAAIIEHSAVSLQAICQAFWFSRMAYKIGSWLKPSWELRYDTLGHLQKLKNLSKVLFIYSESDTWTPPAMGEQMTANCNVQSELWLAKTARHCKTMQSKDAPAYKKKIAQFLNEIVATEQTCKFKKQYEF